MLKIHLIRHGESIANTQGRYQGQTYDTDLSPLGIKQVEKLALRFNDQIFDRAFVSPLKRTRQTAEGLKAKETFIEKALLETNHGLWEGKNIYEIKEKWPEIYTCWLEKPGEVIFPEGEAFTKTVSRSVSWLNEFVGKSGNIVAVTHSNIIFALLTYVLNESIDNMWKYQVQPTSVSVITGDMVGGVWEWNLESLCSIEHLGDLSSDLKKHAI